MAKLTLQALRVFCVPLAPEVFEHLNRNHRASWGDLKQAYPDEAALEATLDALVEQDFLKHIDAFPEMRDLRDFSSYVITAQVLEMGRLLGLEQPGLGNVVVQLVRRVRARFYSATGGERQSGNS